VSQGVGGERNLLQQGLWVHRSVGHGVVAHTRGCGDDIDMKEGGGIQGVQRRGGLIPTVGWLGAGVQWGCAPWDAVVGSLT
jgi:hypothetical protein